MAWRLNIGLEAEYGLEVPFFFGEEESGPCMGLAGWTVDVAAGVDWEGIFLGIVDCCEVDCVAVDGFEGVDVPGEEFVSGRMTGDAPLVVAAFYHRLLLCLQTVSEWRDIHHYEG